jgi:hypothetical protein
LKSGKRRYLRTLCLIITMAKILNTIEEQYARVVTEQMASL